MAKRKIIKIDEEKCNGCGQCVPACHEGAIKIVGGKARLADETACDGLGACIGECPQGAIIIEEREVCEEKPCCPGSRMIDFRKEADGVKLAQPVSKAVLQLVNWPLQIKLVPLNAPYFNGADLLISADCVPFAYAGFHQDLLKGKILLVGCPKLDDLEFYQNKLTQIFKSNNLKSVTYAHMEVPCCFGLINAIKDAIRGSGKDVFFQENTISIRGERIK